MTKDEYLRRTEQKLMAHAMQVILDRDSGGPTWQKLKLLRAELLRDAIEVWEEAHVSHPVTSDKK